MDFLMTNQAGINYALKPPMFTLYDGLIELPFFTRCDETNCVTLLHTVCVPAYNEAYLQVETPHRYNNQEVILEQPPRALSVSVAKALAFCKDNKAVCRVLNSNPYVVTLKKGLKLAKIAGLIDTVLSMQEIIHPPWSTCNSRERKQMRNDVTATVKATVQSIDKSVSNQVTGRDGLNRVTDMGVATGHRPVNQHDLDTFHKDYGFKLYPQLDDEQCYEVLEMLHHYKSVFARDMTEIKLSTGDPMKLELHSNRKMIKRQYGLSEPDKLEMNRQIQQMEKSGVIEPSSSSFYNSPTYLVMKKNGQKRMVVDLRGVNSLIIPKLVQLPQTEELLETITSSKPRYLSCMDILSAYYQIGLSEESRDLTSFTGPDGRHWRYTRAPMGMANSPSALNLLISNIFCDKSRHHSLACYVDDILIYSNKWNDHIQQLELALKTLQENRISCSPTKT